MSRTKIPDEHTKELRQRLDEISGNSPKHLALHRERVDAPSTTHPHSIKYIEDDVGDRSDCMVYTLDIPLDLINVIATFPSILDDFFADALPGLLEQFPEPAISERSVILYFKNGATKHVGRIQGYRVISKWGKNPVYEHEIFEVPASYGDEYEIFKKPSVRYITNKLIEFVRRHSRYIDIRDPFEESVIACGF